jgi:hypothetical protein
MPASHSYYARIGASYHFEEEWLIFACNRKTAWSWALMKFPAKLREKGTRK